MNIHRRTLFSLCLVLVLFFSHSGFANPEGPQVVHGQAGFSNPVPNTLNITNSPNAIINWQGFSVQQNETTRFIQQSADSAVLNRVAGQNPSDILGQLLSNGKVFLINPHGMVFGPNCVIDTAGFVASTLNITDKDFLEGNLHFEGNSDSGAIVNQGFITAGKNGDIYLVAPNIENSGIIRTEGGNLLLAAGEKITITSLDTQGVLFEVQAPENEVVNLGKLLADGGAVEVFAGTLKHSGEIRADTVSVDETGAVILFASNDISLENSSIVSASGPVGGTVNIESKTGTTWAAGTIEARGDAGQGGEIHLLGEQVGLISAATIDASGETGGGTVLVGGDYKGQGDLKTAAATFTGRDTLIKADALTQGDGGKVIVWADETTRAYGQISARGGGQGGDGGFVETSGKIHLDIGDRPPDLSALYGNGGIWLLDPHNVTIQSSTGNLDGQTPDFSPGTDNSTIDASIINTALNNDTSVSINTGSTGSQPGNITIAAAITKSSGTGSPTLLFNAANDLLINSSITDTSTGTLVLNATVGGLVDVNASIDPGGGSFTVGGAGVVQFDGPTVSIAGSFSAGATNISAGTVSFTGTASISTFNLSGGTLNGTGTVTVTDAMNWTGGTISTGGAGSTNIASTGMLAISGANNKTLWAGNFNNAGAATWTDTGNLVMNDGSAFVNSGIFDIQTDADIHYNSSPVPSFTNTGTIKKTVATGETMIGASNAFPFNNTGGIVDVDSGTIRVQSSFTNNGIIDVANGATFQVTGANFTNTATSTIQGSGTIIPPGSGLNNQGTLAPGTSPGIITINGDLTLSSTSVLDFEIGGTTPGTGHDQIVVTGALSTPDNFGTLTLTEILGYIGDFGHSFAIITCASGGNSGTFSTINHPASFTVTDTYNPGEIRLDIANLLYLWSLGGDGNWGTGTNWDRGAVPGSNDKVGIVDGTSTVTLDAGSYTIDTLSLAAGNTLLISGSGDLTINNNSTLDGDLTLAGGVLQGLGNLTSKGSFNWTGGVISITGNIYNEIGAVFNAMVQGPLAVSAFHNYGTLTMGGSPGALTIDGDYVQGPNGVLDIELGGLTQGVTYDWLNITGTAALNGTLNISFYGGFTGSAGNQFNIMTYAGGAAGVVPDQLFAAVSIPGGYSFLMGDQGPVYQLKVISIPETGENPVTPPPAIKEMIATTTQEIMSDIVSITKETSGNQSQNGESLAAELAPAQKDENEDEEKKRGRLICR